MKKYIKPMYFVLLRMRFCVILMRDSFVDFVRFLRYANISNQLGSREEAQAFILRLSHSLEKGLALPSPKKPFGREKCLVLLKFTERYRRKYGADAISSAGIEAVRRVCAVCKFKDIDDAILGVSGAAALLNYSPVRHQDRKTFKASLPLDPEMFFGARKSVRQFSEEPVTRELVARAIKLAMSAPSVCNRQTARVRSYSGVEEIKKVLSFQDGNRGFGEGVGVVFIITSDLRSFFKSGERNQGYVDGGLFAMTLCLALHSLGLGTCFLNWSMSAGQDGDMRAALGIPSNEVVVTFLGAGTLRSEWVVAESPRKALDEVWIS